jgi:hypothetical protein
MSSLVDSIQLIKLAVADEFNISVGALDSRRNQRVFTVPRHVAFLVAYELLPQVSMPAIARCFDRDHTTVLQGLRAIRERMIRDAVLMEKIGRVKAQCKERVAGQDASAIGLKTARYLAHELGQEIGRGLGEAISKHLAAAFMRLSVDNPRVFLDLLGGEPVAVAEVEAERTEALQ